MWKIVVLIIFVACWYYIICFTEIYSRCSIGWLYGCILSLIMNTFIIGFIKPIVLVIIKVIIKLI